MSEKTLNSWVAIMVALTATFMALCGVKDGNIVQNMYQAEFKAIDYWNYYQAKNNKQEIIESTLETLAMHKGNEISIEKLKKEHAELVVQKAKIKLQAEGYEKSYNDMNMFDDQFDLVEALFSISLTLLGIASLTEKRWLFYFALSFIILGAFLGLTAFLGISVHSQFMANILS